MLWNGDIPLVNELLSLLNSAFLPFMSVTSIAYSPHVLRYLWMHEMYGDLRRLSRGHTGVCGRVFSYADDLALIATKLTFRQINLICEKLINHNGNKLFDDIYKHDMGGG